MLKSVIDPYGVLCCVSGGGMPQIESALGIIKAIYAAKFCRFDHMWGTSAGAIVSAVNMSFDQDTSRFEKVLRETDPDKWFKLKPWQAVKSIFGLSNYVADNTGFKDFLLENVSQDAVERVRCAVTELPGGRVGKSVMCSGQPRAVLASMSFQHVFPPVIWDGIPHGDGGVFNNIPIPSITELPKYTHVYIILAADTPLFPRFKYWPFLDSVLNLVDRTMCREVAQLEELGIGDLPNVTVLQPPEFVKSADFLHWSKDFEQIEASYNYALNVLEKEG